MMRVPNSANITITERIEVTESSLLNAKRMATGQSRHPERESNVILVRIGLERARH